MKFRNIIWVLLIFASCQQEDPAALKQEVIDTDKNFSLRAQEKGITEAFVYYADEKVIRPQEGQQPIFGKYALMESYEKNPPNYSLTWEPLRAEVSGTLAYTFGGYTLTTKTAAGRDTVTYGNYVSIWKRKKDGSWRYVLDIGNSTPGPVKLQGAE
jgi:ketosteroid isomerase-like protein